VASNDPHRARAALDAALERASAHVTRPTHVVDLPLPSLGTVERPSVEAGLWRTHVRYARRREPAVRAELVEHYLPFARSLAARSFRHREPLDDLQQVAMEGLLVALDRFEPDRRRPFVAYANPTISGMIKHHYRDAGWTVRVPRWVHDLAVPLRRAEEMLEQDLGHPPTDAEIADLLDLDVEQVRATRRADRARTTASLDAPSLNTEDRPLASRLPDVDPGFDWIDNRTAVAQTVRQLPEEDRELLRLYYVENLSQAKIAARRGVSQMQISRLLGGIVRRLRSHLVEV
jgi:RNA polymerase sigma-B factor